MTGRNAISSGKPLPISKQMVWHAYLEVKGKGKAAGVDNQSLEDNLYLLWNRMASGSYFPPAVRQVEIPKGNGGKRLLGIPTVMDRIAQMVVKRFLDPELDVHFDPDSYGYRPGKSAHEAVGRARERCWRRNWVLDLDIKSFFDTIDHGLMMRALGKHTPDKWVLMYVRRWLEAPAPRKEGLSVRCWRICFCIMPLIAGCVSTTPVSSLSDTQMTLSAIVSAGAGQRS